MNRNRRIFDLTKDLETALYWISLFVIFIVAVSFLVMFTFVDMTGHNELLDCQMKKLWNLPCPGCGGTRAIISFFKGDILKSLYYNAFATYCCVVYGVFFVTQTLRIMTDGKIKGMKYRDLYIVLALIVLVVQYVLKLLVPELRV